MPDENIDLEALDTREEPPIEEPEPEPAIEEPEPEPEPEPQPQQGLTYEEALDEIAAKAPHLLKSRAAELEPEPPPDQDEVPPEVRASQRLDLMDTIVEDVVKAVPEAPKELIAEIRKQLRGSTYTLEQLRTVQEAGTVTKHVKAAVFDLVRQGKVKTRGNEEPAEHEPVNAPARKPKPKVTDDEKKRVVALAKSLKADPKDVEADYIKHRGA